MTKTRFAPSPTGFLHVGGLRTALYAYLFARKNNGTFMLRIEDTDQERFVEGGIENIIGSLQWAGLDIDEGVDLDKDHNNIVQKGELGPYIQSERKDKYIEHVEKLLDAGAAYYAFDTKEDLDKMREKQKENGKAPQYNRHIMENETTLDEEEVKKRLERGDEYVVRLKVPQHETIEFEDKVMGKVSFSTDEIDDQILVKSDGMPTYHLANVVDDHYMEVTDVIRGEEWLPSTPKHIIMYKALGWDVPNFAHLSLLVNKEKQKLSKRHGDVSVYDYREKGYIKEAMINFLAFLGWNPGDEREIFSLEDLEQEFTLDRVQKSKSVFDLEKLNWYNKQYMKRMDIDKLTERAIPFFKNSGILEENDIDEQKEYDWLKKVVALEQERATNLVDLVESVGFVFADSLEYEIDLLVWRDADKADAKEKLTELIDLLEDFDKDWNKDTLEEVIFPWIKEEKEYGVGNVLWPMRVALAGRKNSPGPFEIAGVLGQEKTLKRFKEAINKLS